jgi:hypothetical protein
MLTRQGTVTGLLRRRVTKDFAMERVGGRVGTAASAAGFAAMGMGGAAISAASLSAKEDADYVEFDLDGLPVRGWFWRFPFSDGDVLEIAGEDVGEHWVAYGARRPSDELVSMFPHCYEGVRSHYLSSAYLWGMFGLFIFLGLSFFGVVYALLDDKPDKWTFFLEGYYYVVPVSLGLWLFMWLGGARRFLPFARQAEEVFRAFGWPNPSWINLRKRSKERRRETELREYGNSFFRY